MGSLSEKYPDFFKLLPKNVLNEIANKLSYFDILKFCQTYSVLSELCRSNNFWQYLVSVRFPTVFRSTAKLDMNYRELFESLTSYEVFFYPDLNVKFSYITMYEDNLIPLFDMFQFIESEADFSKLPHEPATKYSGYLTARERKFNYPRATILIGGDRIQVDLKNFHEVRTKLGLSFNLIIDSNYTLYDIQHLVLQRKIIITISVVVKNKSALYIANSDRSAKLFIDMSCLLSYLETKISIYQLVVKTDVQGYDKYLISFKDYGLAYFNKNGKCYRNKVKLGLYDPYLTGNNMIYQTFNPDDIYWNYGITA